MMIMRRRPARCQFVIGLGVLYAALGPLGVVNAGSLHVRDSAPEAEVSIRGRHAEYVIRFDGLVDHSASRIDIIQAGHVVQSLPPLLDSAPDVLFASGEVPAPGRYLLHWQARSAADGTVSNGDIPFSVAP